MIEDVGVIGLGDFEQGDGLGLGEGGGEAVGRPGGNDLVEGAVKQEDGARDPRGQIDGGGSVE